MPVKCQQATLGFAGSRRFQNDLCLSAQPEYEASRACVSSRAGSSGEGGTPVTAGEGCCSTSYSQPRRLLLEFAPGTQKEWANETSDQPETVEQLGDSGTLQDGRYPHLLQSGDWLVKVDLKDAYFTVPYRIEGNIGGL